MIPTLDQLLASIRGAWKLMVWDRKGLEEFDQSIDGFWQSFIGPLMAMPAAILISVARLAIADEARAANPDLKIPEIPSTGLYLALDTATYVIEVALFPLLMILVVRRISLAARYVPFIIAWNWVNALWVCIFAIPHLLFIVGIIGLQSMYGFQLVVLGFGLLGLYFATWVSLETPPLVATVILGLGMVLGLFLAEVASLLVI